MHAKSLRALASVIAFASLLAFEPSTAAELPAGPLRFICPNPPGGPHDIIIRLLVSKLTLSLDRPVVVDNKPGAGMILATSALARATPDGLTLGTVAVPHLTNPYLVPSLPYETAKDFSPVALVMILPMMMVVGPNSPYRTLKELITAAQQHPGSLKFSSTGNGGAVHLAGEMLKKAAGIDILHVPYKGAPDARLALLRGDVDFTFDNPEALELVRAGKLHALGFATSERLPIMPEMPTLSETVPGFTVEAFIGVMAPAHTPPEIVQKLNVAINEATKSPEVDSKLKAMMWVPMTMSVDQYKTFLDEQALKWGTLIKTQKLSLQ